MIICKSYQYYSYCYYSKSTNKRVCRASRDKSTTSAPVFTKFNGFPICIVSYSPLCDHMRVAWKVLCCEFEGV